MAPTLKIVNLNYLRDNRGGKHLLKKENNQSNKNKFPSSDEDDCVILDGDPDKPVKVAAESQKYGSSDELLIVAEKGQVACRDYPHPRHLCARFPFSANPHEKYCDMCHCYVCDTQAPCVYWGTGNSDGDHCHSTDKEEMWRVLRQSFKQCKTTQLPTSIHSATFLSNVPPLHPTLSCPQPLNSGEDREALSGLGLALDRLSLQSAPLTGAVKWFNCQRGYGFICPDGGGEDLFVHQSSIKSDSYRRLTEGALVEFQIEIGDDGRKQAIDVSVHGVSIVRVTTRRNTYCSDTSNCYNCGETGHFARNCPYTGSDDEETVCLAGLRLLFSDRLTGTVKWFNTQKGYGFITPEDGGEDLFVHQSSIKSEGYRSLAEGEVVEFQIESGGYGRKKAVNVSGPGGSFVRGTTDDTSGCSSSDDIVSDGSDSSECYYCEDTGHLARDCYHYYHKGGDGGGGSSRRCYTCGEPGHLARYCSKGGGGGGACYNCGEHGHFARECVNQDRVVERALDHWESYRVIN